MPKGGRLDKTARQRAFLAAFRTTGGNFMRAAKIAKVDRSTERAWRKNDEHYAELFKEAQQEAGETLEAEATRRAYEGVDRPMSLGGGKYMLVREYDSRLLMFLLTGIFPQKYRQYHVSGPTGGAIPLSVIDKLLSVDSTSKPSGNS